MENRHQFFDFTWLLITYYLIAVAQTLLMCKFREVHILQTILLLTAHSNVDTKNMFQAKNELDISSGVESPAFSMGDPTPSDGILRYSVENKIELVSGDVLKVYVGFYVETMGNIDTTTMSFDADIYLRLSWQDSRLSHDEVQMKRIRDYNTLSFIWIPDIYFTNAQRSNFHTVTVPNFSLRIGQDGTVAYSTRVSLRVNCPLRLMQYPLDDQVCPIMLQSYGHTVEEMELLWFAEDPVSFNEEIHLPEFSITNDSLHTCNGTYVYAQTSEKGLKGQFSCLQYKIYLDRSITYHLVQTYIPTALIVTISWVSFWIDRNAVPARVTLSFTTLLTLSTMASGVRFSLPPVSYAKAIDFWLGACMLFVIAALLEFAFINSLTRRVRKHQTEMCTILEKSLKLTKLKQIHVSFAGKLEGMGALSDIGCFAAVLAEEADYLSRLALYVDKICRFFFPSMFFIFNLIYWFYYSDLIPGYKWLKSLGLA